ncbi:MAG: glycosyltransferase family 39 protein [Bacteroidales bacterium]|nr:glycosyltransferase family 39 protein [Bacteroidales bacterium]
MSALPTTAVLPRSLPEWLPYLWNHVLFSGNADPRTRPRFLSLVLVLLLPATLLYPTLSYRLLEPDEGRYAQIPREMLLAEEWIVPTLQGEAYLDKPPLMYWLVRLSYTVFGINEFAARLVPAICVHLTILAVYLMGRRSLGERAALWAALLLTASPGFLGVARLLLLDGLLTLCVTTSLLCAYEAVRTGRLLRGWWVAAAVASGLGFLTKGPISEVLLFPPLVAIAWLTRSTARVGWRDVALFGLIVLAVNLPWYIGIYRQQPEFLGYFFWQHNVMRFLKPFDHLQPVWYYVPILLGGFLPGVLIGASLARRLLLRPTDSQEALSSAGGFWLLVGAWCVFFFSCSGSKLPTYILPAFPPLCLALGDFLARSSWNTATATRMLLGGMLLLMGMIIHVGLPWYAEHRSPMVRPDLIAQYVADPNTVVVTYPRNLDSVAFYTQRNDLRPVRTTELNSTLVDCHFREKTVFLFTHDHSYQAFCEALPPSLRVATHESLRRVTGYGRLADRLVGETPWGLCDIAVIVPVQLQSR